MIIMITIIWVCDVCEEHTPIWVSHEHVQNISVHFKYPILHYAKSRIIITPLLYSDILYSFTFIAYSSYYIKKSYVCYPYGSKLSNILTLHVWAIPWVCTVKRCCCNDVWETWRGYKTCHAAEFWSRVQRCDETQGKICQVRLFQQGSPDVTRN